jgi:nitroreductase
MDGIELIHTRHSVSKVLPDPVPRDLIEKLLEAAVQAPNHYRVYPWRLIVLTGAARERLGEVMAQSLRERVPESAEGALETERARPLRAPVLIAVGVEKPRESKVSEVENLCAAAAAAQNILLAARALGLGAMWRTGPAAVDPRVKAFLGLEPDQHLIAFIYVGYPAGPTEPPQRPPFNETTVWMEA